MNTPILFEDIFEVVKRDPDGKKFDKGTHNAVLLKWRQLRMKIPMHIGIGII